MLRHDVCHCKGEHDGVVCPKREEWSIQYVQIEHKQGLNEYNEWVTKEWTWVYEVRCIDTETKKERVINIEPHTPSLVVIWE